MRGAKFATSFVRHAPGMEMEMNKINATEVAVTLSSVTAIVKWFPLISNSCPVAGKFHSCSI